MQNNILHYEEYVCVCVCVYTHKQIFYKFHY